jgi:ABC-type multidrug transport system fused ATPase/permease subunit
MLADLATPWPIAIAVDSAIGRQPVNNPAAVALGSFSGSPVVLLTAAVVGSIVLVAVSGLFDYLGDRAMNGAGERITAAIRSDLYAHLQRLPVAYHDRHTVGELVSRMSVDTTNVQAALVAVFSTLLPSILTMVGVFLILILVNWQLGLVVGISAPLIYITVNRYARLMRRGARRRRACEGSLAGLVAETLAGIRTVQALGRHELHDQHFNTANQQTLGAGLRLVELRARFVPLVELCASLGTGAMVWVGAWGYCTARGRWGF